eukprot:4573451-Prymnesium_polylepis.2
MLVSLPRMVSGLMTVPSNRLYSGGVSGSRSRRAQSTSAERGVCKACESKNALAMSETPNAHATRLPSTWHSTCCSKPAAIPMGDWWGGMSAVAYKLATWPGMCDTFRGRWPMVAPGGGVGR